MSTYVTHKTHVHDLDAAIAFIEEHRHEFPEPKISIDVMGTTLVMAGESGSVKVSIEGYVR